MTGITVITPTRDRPQAFALCRQWMAAQELAEPFQWIVVDDGDVPIQEGPFEHLRRPPSGARNTLPDNLIEALARARGDRIVIVEDDDFYAPGYLALMAEHLRKDWAAGEVRARYYNVKSRRWHVGPDPSFASLCRTGFRREAADLVRKSAEETKRAGDVSVDIRFWAAVKRAALPFALFEQPKLTVSIKGLPGRAGLGKNHAADIFPHKDPEGLVLKTWVGEAPFSEYARIFP
jgi:glycosyltransferase involved in cell wall biosynthesis